MEITQPKPPYQLCHANSSLQQAHIAIKIYLCVPNCTVWPRNYTQSVSQSKLYNQHPYNHKEQFTSNQSPEPKVNNANTNHNKQAQHKTTSINGIYCPHKRITSHNTYNNLKTASYRKLTTHPMQALNHVSAIAESKAYNNLHLDLIEAHNPKLRIARPTNLRKVKLGHQPTVTSIDLQYILHNVIINKLTLNTGNPGSTINPQIYNAINFTYNIQSDLTKITLLIEAKPNC
eukprot:gene3560-2511_t